MAQNTITVGNGGRWQIIVDIVSQDQSGGSTLLRVRGVMHNTSGRSYDSSGVDISVSGDGDWSGNRPFDIPGGGSFTMIDVNFRIYHTSARNVSFTARLGPTLSGTFGGGGSVATSVTLPALTPPAVIRRPDPPNRPSLALRGLNDVRMNWTAPRDNGGTITGYRVRVDDQSNFSSPDAAEVGNVRTRDFNNLVMGRTWHFQVAARNSIGWSDWSPYASIYVPTAPASVGILTLEYTPPTTMRISFSAPNNGGATITSYILEYANNPEFSGYKTATSTTPSFTVDDLTIGDTWYFRVYAKNKQGSGGRSPVSEMLVVSGPRVFYNGAWRNSVVYVKYNGVWQVATPYVKYNDTWKLAGA